MASISLQNVTKVFERHTTAVSHLTLEVRDGEFLVLVGPSGCGKTTILRLIAGLESPTSGEIRLAGRSIADVTPRNRNVAMVFQDGVLYPHLSVWANLAFPLRLRGLSRKEVKRRVGEVVGMLGLADLVHRKPAALSGGQRQRVALGRAIVRTPAAFLFDEPLSSVDPALRTTLRAEIKALHRRLHTTTLYVTHDQSEAMALGERVAVLREGQIQQVGRPTDIYDRPVNRFVAGFFGTPPMNFLEGHIRFQNGTDFVDLAGGTVSLPASLSLPSMESEEKLVVMGVRPHELALEPAAGQEDNVLSGRVCLLEPFGARTDVHVIFPSGEKCIISAPPHVSCRIEEEVRVRVDSNRLHLFRPDGATLEGV
jgi:multiple sugar transport system ATP-binding protein